MATLEERVSILEARVDEQFPGMSDVRESIRSLDVKVDQRFDALSSRIHALDEKLDRRFDILDQKFTWLLGLQVTMLLAFLTASLGAIGILLTR